MRTKDNDGQSDQRQAESMGLADEPTTGHGPRTKPTDHESKPYTKPYKEKCELTGEEVRSMYGTFRSFNERHLNNPNSPHGDLEPLKRELARIGWYDCTEWDVNKHLCTNPTCEWGLHV